eukprot:CAMPEP_0117673734 /NCGR_PEP_ID=MMETSP0804-20121206/14637_1 /TAXON_ID=1074897 /ORGANISM="Tetraselmis astigmatica, Strain CCMP880" /LENGTH=126 /DNA_ID=CAMNT_0005482505 /DNA_START=351 /DNA_END=731 /DNA_ORIENTATION=-
MPARHLLQSPTVQGVGAGLFVLLFFGALLAVLCLAFSKTKYNQVVYITSGAVYALLLFILLVLPRGPYPEYTVVNVWDWSMIWLVGIFMVMLCGVGCSAAGMLICHVMPPVKARRLNEFQDVLRIK